MVAHHCTSNTNGRGLGRRTGGNLVFLNTHQGPILYIQGPHKSKRKYTQVKKKKFPLRKYASRSPVGTEQFANDNTYGFKGGSLGICVGEWGRRGSITNTQN